ncbi:hypothetical protein AN219_14850 [Streptomyces nanshensis]|nr:hypothetical protein AN219_14850 [Streptomyces nanshensis]
MAQGFTEIGALLRSLRLATGLPSAAAAAHRSLPELTEAYERVVAPFLTETLTDPGERERAETSLRAMSVKFGLAMLAYARLTGRAPRPDVAVLAGGVTRLYDDIIDGGGDPSADARLADLLGNRPFTAGTEAELLLGRLVYEIERRLGHTPDESLLTALVSLHEHQVLSRRQREADVPVDVLEKITSGKGRAANLILCGIVHPGLDSAERELAMDLGEALQSLDDYMDADLDRAHGVTTLATLGVSTLPQIAQRLRAIRPRLVACYGRRLAGPYCGMLYFLLLKSWVGRRLPVFGRLASRPARNSAVLAFLSRGADALPPSGPGSRP